MKFVQAQFSLKYDLHPKIRRSVNDIEDFLQQHEKINVNLQITKITTHISNFDFEEEFEEI